jgi:flavorubredoxin
MLERGGNIMNYAVPISEDIYWIGVNDRETHLFEALWPLPEGVSYNAYIICDEKVALIDTVKVNSSLSYLDKIENVLKGTGKKVDYLIINHMEPDHSGSIKVLLKQYPDIQIIGNKKTMGFLEGFYGISENVKVVGNGDVLDLGKRKLTFYLTPMVHWPETMMTYDETDKVLFSGDAFGGFGTLDGGIFDDEVNISFYEDEIRRYFSNIVGKFGKTVLNAIKKLSGLDIKVIASTHGPIWRKDPGRIIEDYRRWSSHETEEGVVIAYGSMYGNTEKMADKVARVLSEEGIENIRVFNVSRTHISYIVNDIWRFKGLVLGSCTYNLGLFPPMGTLLHTLENKLMQNRVLGVFGTYSWSGGGVTALTEFGQRGNWKMIEPIVEAHYAPKPEDIEHCILLAQNMAKEVKE